MLCHLLYFVSPLTKTNSFFSFCRFEIEDRAIISHIFHQWAKKQAFQNPKRLLDKVLNISFYIGWMPYAIDSFL